MRNAIGFLQQFVVTGQQTVAAVNAVVVELDTAVATAAFYSTPEPTPPAETEGDTTDTKD